jgi:flagellar hook assembly protein FlgD
VTWTVQVKNAAGDVLDTTSGSGQTFAVPWDGLVDGVAVADGTYTWSASGTDAWLNGVATGGGSLVVDTVAPDLTGISPDGSTVGLFSPNGDGVSDTITTTATSPEAGTLSAWVTGTGGTVRAWTATSVAGANAVMWDGKTAGGSVVPNGDYTLFVAARDATGNQGPARSRPLHVVSLLGFVTSSAKVFYPQDADRLSRTTTLSFRIATPATVTWRIVNAAGQTVRTRLADAALGAGTQTWAWDGRSDGGAFVPRGVYRSVVTATDGTDTVSQSVTVETNAFKVAVSDATPARRQRITITATSAESLKGSPKVYISQPGLATWSVTLTKVDSRTWKATVTLKTSSSGTLRLKVYGHDADGRAQSTTKTLPLH